MIKRETKVLAQKDLYTSKYFSVIEKTVEVGGKFFKKEFLKRRSVVLIAAMTSTNQIYLAKQYREALERESLELIAGTLDEGEDSLTAAKRELSEESGLVAKRWILLKRMEISANMVASVDLYLAQDIKEGMAHQNADENIEILRLPLSEAVEKAMNGDIFVASHVAAILLINDLVKEGKI